MKAKLHGSYFLAGGEKGDIRLDRYNIKLWRLSRKYEDVVLWTPSRGVGVDWEEERVGWGLGYGVKAKRYA